ncbi:transposase is801/is1294 [Lucifera butyrica]|uniref:Transposase is801/is1294 n=1 Tax=Lucifera butyrica TaxID=1351585 RepID=A0A498RD05_9FIRM|nr:transposase [Lucifera butyrica]VBB09331.1 transposase is801/is1294 [Lucifera butyrica]
MHTFGSRLNFNPHVHILVSMGGMKESGEWKTYDFIPFTMLRKQWQTAVLKFIRRSLNEEQKSKVQPLLQATYKENAEGFYVYAPKQRGKIQIQLKYIGRYMRRPAIGLNRIVNYDGERVSFKYQDKTSGEEKLETVSVEEFIGRLIKHIPDEQFKLIRHYGIYSRRIKTLSKKLIVIWQKTIRKWLVAAKRLVRRDWSERIKDHTGKDPMECPVCGCYYEYKGGVYPKDGQLIVRYAKESMARDCLERMISYITGNEEEKEKGRKTNTTAPNYCPIQLFGM